jgi:DNA-binding GntR family transcriptional regulator
MMFEKRYISTQLCPKLSQKDLEGSLYEIYEKDYGCI